MSVINKIEGSPPGNVMNDRELDAIVGGKGGGNPGPIIWWAAQCVASGFARLIDGIVKKLS